MLTPALAEQVESWGTNERYRHARSWEVWQRDVERWCGVVQRVWGLCLPIVYRIIAEKLGPCLAHLTSQARLPNGCMHA
jgi:hypothetical protein